MYQPAQAKELSGGIRTYCRLGKKGWQDEHVKIEEVAFNTFIFTLPRIRDPEGRVHFSFCVHKMDELKHVPQKVVSLEFQHSAPQDSLRLSNFLHWSNDEHPIWRSLCTTNMDFNVARFFHSHY